MKILIAEDQPTAALFLRRMLESMGREVVAVAEGEPAWQLVRDGDDRRRPHARIVEAVIDLGRNLGLKVVAEGVEDEPTLKFLESLGCDSAQGYSFAPPLAPADFADWLPQTHRSIHRGMHTRSRATASPIC